MRRGHYFLLLVLSLLSLSIFGGREVLFVSDNYADQAVAGTLGKEIVTVPWGWYSEAEARALQCRGNTVDKVLVIGGPRAVVENYTTGFYWDEQFCETCRMSCVGEGEEEECDLECETESRGVYCGSAEGLSTGPPSSSRGTTCWLVRHALPWERIGGLDRRWTAYEVFKRFKKDKALVTDGWCKASVERARLETKNTTTTWLQRLFGGSPAAGIVYEAPRDIALARFGVNIINYTGVLLNLSMDLGNKNIEVMASGPGCY